MHYRVFLGAVSYSSAFLVSLCHSRIAAQRASQKPESFPAVAKHRLRVCSPEEQFFNLDVESMYAGAMCRRSELVTRAFGRPRKASSEHPKAN